MGAFLTLLAIAFSLVASIVITILCYTVSYSVYAGFLMNVVWLLAFFNEDGRVKLPWWGWLLIVVASIIIAKLLQCWNKTKRALIFSSASGLSILFSGIVCVIVGFARNGLFSTKPVETDDPLILVLYIIFMAVFCIYNWLNIGEYELEGNNLLAEAISFVLYFFPGMFIGNMVRDAFFYSPADSIEQAITKNNISYVVGGLLTGLLLTALFHIIDNISEKNLLQNIKEREKQETKSYLKLGGLEKLLNDLSVNPNLSPVHTSIVVEEMKKLPTYKESESLNEQMKEDIDKAFDLIKGIYESVYKTNVQIYLGED